MTLQIDRTDDEDSFICRGLRLAARADVEVKLTFDRKRSIKVQPWTQYDVAKYNATQDVF